MSISEKLLEFTKSLDSTYEGESAADRYLREDTKMWSDIKAEKELQKMSMADRMSMGMGAMGTLYGSAAEQAGIPTQEWAAQNLTADGMDQAGMSLNQAAGNWTPEQMQVFQGIGAVPSQMMQPVQQPQMPQQPQLTQTQQNVVAGENSMNRMQQEVDYAKAQQAAQAKNQMAQQQQQNAGIASLSEEEVDTARDNTKSLVQQAVVDQTDNIDDTTQAAKETQGWSEEHFRGAIKVIDSLIEQTNPQSAEYMSLQNRRADLIRVYESQKGSDDPYRAMEGQIATNQSQAQQKDDTAQMQLLADEQQATVAQAQDIQAGIADEADTRQMLADWDEDTQMDTQMSEADDMYADLDSNYAARTMAQGFKSTDEEQARQQYSREIAQGFRKNDDRIRAQQADKRAEWDMNRADDQFAKLDDEVDTRQMLGIWDAETQMSEVDDMYADLDDEYDKHHQQKSRDMAKKFKEQDDIKREQAEDAEFAKQDELETQKMLGIWDEETAADEYKQEELDTEALNKDVRFGASDKSPDWLGDSTGAPGARAEAKAAANLKALDFTGKKPQIKVDESTLDPQMSNVDGKQLSPVDWGVKGLQNLEAAKKASVETPQEAVVATNTLKGAVTSGPLTAKGLDAKALEMYLEGEKMLNMKNSDKEWGAAMMQFGLTLMSTPGSLLNAVGIAGKEALKTWKETKKDHNALANKKQELALKYAKLAETKRTATDDTKEKMYTKWEVNEDGTISTSQVVGKKTGKERAGQRLNDMSALSTKGVLDRLTQKQAAQFANDYISAYNSSNTISRFGDVQNDTGKENPLLVLSKLRKKYPNDKELSNIEFALRSNRPLTVVQSETKAKKTSYNGLMTSYSSLIKKIEDADDKATTWLGNATSNFSKLVSPLWNSNANVGDNAASIEKAFEETFASSFTDVVKANNEIKGLIRTLARQRLMARHSEKGKSISNDDMRDEVHNIAALGDWGAAKSTIINQLQSARKSDLEVYGSEWESAFANRDNFLMGFTGENKAIAYNLAFGEGRDEAEGGSNIPPSNSGTPPTTIEQVSHHLPAAHKELAKLIAIHGEGSDEVPLGLQKYLQGKGLSESQIQAVFDTLKPAPAQK